MKKRLLYIFIGMLFFSRGYAGPGKDTLTLTLREVVEMAKNKSIDSKQAVTTKETKYWLYRTFRSNYQPQLLLNGTLPGYSKTFTQVVQPDGTIQFQPIHNNNSSLNLIAQPIIIAGCGMINLKF